MKNIKNIKKKHLNLLGRSCAAFLTVAFIFSFKTYASVADIPRGKEEVVYAMLNNDGSINGMYVVNIFDKKGSINDYGDYSSVRNLTTKDKISQNGNNITVTNTGEKLYYEGTMKKLLLPWSISMKYYIGDKEYSAKDIAGKTGSLTMKMNITQNKSCNDAFYKNYALQATFTLDSNKCKNIKADGATIANVGSNKQLTYTIMPDKGADVTITADVTDFEMKAATINGIMLNLNFKVDDPKIMEKVDELKSAVSKLDNGASDLKDGASSLKDGADKLASGTSELKNGSANLDSGTSSLKAGIQKVQDGLMELDSKSPSLQSGSAQVKSALHDIQAGLSKVSITSNDIDALVKASSDIKEGINGIYSGINSLKVNVGYSQYKAAMLGGGLDIDKLKSGNEEAIKTLTAQISTLTSSYNQIKDIPAYESEASQLKKQIDELNGIVTLLTGNNGALGGMEKYLNNVSYSITKLYDGAYTLKSQYEVFNTKVQELGETLKSMSYDMTKLSDGINTLVKKYSDLDGGINDYTGGVSKITSGYSGIVSGASNLSDGSKKLSNGSSVLYSGTADLTEGISRLYDGTSNLKNGTGEFKGKTSNMDTEVSDQIDEVMSKLTGDGYKPVSFVSNENGEVKSVQFVIKTNDIEVQKKINHKKKTVKTLTVWQKFLKLFEM